MDSLEAQRTISRYRGDALVVPTMTTNAEWPQVSTAPDLDMPLAGAMGKASSVALGLALARPERKVFILDGDGSLLMNLGSLITIAGMAPPNLYHFVFQNNVYRVSGGQPIPGAGKFNFAILAKGAGYAAAYEYKTLRNFQKALPQILGRPGPALICLHVPPAKERSPYPMATAVQGLPRVRAALAKAKG